MLQVEDISMSYGDEVVLEHISLSVEKGTCLVIFGPSGCGKTTLLHLMAGLKKPTDGYVTYKGERVVQPVQDIAMIFQGYGLFPWKTVRENLILPCRIRKEKVDEEALADTVAALGLSDHLGKYPNQLSGGQKQRVAIGRAMLNKSKIILMDEPFSALDMDTKKKLERCLKKIFEEKNVTVVMVTHSIEEALIWGDRIAVFDKKGGGFDQMIDNPYKDQIKNIDAFKRMISGENSHA